MAELRAWLEQEIKKWEALQTKQGSYSNMVGNGAIGALISVKKELDRIAKAPAKSRATTAEEGDVG